MKSHEQQIQEDLEQLRTILKEEQQEERSFLRKTLFLLGALTILLLLVSFVFVSYPLGDILSGQLQSFPLLGKVIDIGSLLLVFENNTQQQLNLLYLQHPRVEWSACLQGTLEQNEQKIYRITSLYRPLMYEQSFNHVSFEPCAQDTLIVLHSHPYKSCRASATDIETLAKTKQSNPQVLMVVMCEPQRFAVYE